MHITFIWNDKEYEVINFDVSLGTAGKFADAAAGEIELTLRGDPESGAFKSLYEFGSDQEAQANSASGKIVVKPTEDKESIETIEMKSGYFSMISQDMSKIDESVYLTVKVRAAEVSVSKAKFEDKKQLKIVGG